MPVLEKVQQQSHGSRRLCVSLFLASSFLWLPAAPNELDGSASPITEGQVLSQTALAGELFSYTFAAELDQTYLIEVYQDGLDFVVSVEDPSGILRSYNSPLRRDESEFVLLESSVDGIYHITLGSEEHTNAKGAYTIQINALDDITQQLNAWRLMSEGAAANAEGTLASKETALSLYRAASDSWRLLGRYRELAFALYSSGIIEYWDLYDWSSSVEFASEAAELYHDLNKPALYANAIFLHGYALVELASEQQFDDAQLAFDKALALYEEARGIHENLGNLYEIATTINFTGVAAFNRGELQQAKKLWDDAAARFASIDEWGEEFKVRQNLAVINIEEGFTSEAIQTYEYIVDNLPGGKDPELLATVLDNLGAAYRDFGNIDNALQSYATALEIQNQREDRRGSAVSLRGLGITYFVSGELDLASQYLRQALPLAEQAGDGRSQASILTNLGNIAFIQGDYSTALALHQDGVDRTKSIPDLANRQFLVSKDLVAMGRYSDAMMRAQRALELSGQAGVPVTRADSLQMLGRASIELGESRKAVAYLEEALDIYESLGQQGGQADALNGLAFAARAEGNLDKAIRLGEASLTKIENLRSKVTTPELRALYSAARRSYYENQIDILMESFEASVDANHSNLLAALTTSERGRARMTMDMLSEASIELERGLDADMIKRRRDLTDQLAALAYQRNRLLEKEYSIEEDDDAMSELLNKMAAIETELNILEADFRRTSAQYAGFTSPENLTATEIQSLIGPSSILLHYSLGNTRSFVWVVTSESIRGIEIADRHTIESIARQAFDALKNFEQGAGARRSLDETLLSLSRHVLSPVAEFLGDRRILVAAEGGLQYVPFAVLPLESDGTVRPLLQTNEIVGLPSASVLAAQRTRQVPARRSRTLAVFADPVLNESDPRLGGSNSAVTAARATTVGFITRSSITPNLVRLASTGYEANVIGELVPEEARVIATGFDASRKSVFDLDLEQYRIVHFATHGLVDSRYPALSALALSQFDRRGNPQNGFLRLHDIYNLELNADLVVLSACQTALGREIRGEGLVGLTQAFMYAGAKSLVVSLWQVEDRATAELMSHFYRYIFDSGLKPADALRQAQLSIAANRRWADPYFWGAFTLLGDWL